MTEFIIIMPLAIQLLGITFIVFRDKYLTRGQRTSMLIIISLITLLVTQNCVEYVLETYVSKPYIRTLVSSAGYILRPAIIVFFCKLVAPDKKHIAAFSLLAANTLTYITPAFSHLVFYISEGNHFQRGPLGYTAYFMSAVLIAYLVVISIIEFRHRKSALWVVLANAAIVIVSASLELTPAYVDYPVDYLTIAVVSCSLFYYFWLHLEFVRKHEDALMAEQRIKIMMSQIQPHFLYNTLSTIQSLCRTEPKKAFETTGKFGTYLRHNIDFLDMPDLIPLESELEHTKLYTDIEMLRFPKISVEYDIQAGGFDLPPLTIQPLVENAIRHGVRARDEGKVFVLTREEDGFYVIRIKDNGVGFDPDAAGQLEGNHIGLSNVSERIRDMCSGTFEINSVIGQGTEITIKIPKTEEEKK